MSENLVGIALAAGMGTRLRPITGAVPKPLVPFFGIPLLEFIIKKLNRASVADIGINTHYLPNKIFDYLKEYNHSSFFVSKELPEIMGTGGAYYGFKNWIGTRNAISHNGDVLTSTDLDALIYLHDQTQATATLAVLDRPHNSGSQIWADGGRVVHIGKDHGGHEYATPHGFACIQMISQSFLQSLQNVGYAEFVPLINQLIKDEHFISAYVHRPHWFDLGNPQDYFDCHMFVLDEISQGRDPFGVLATLNSHKVPYSFVPKGQELSMANSIFIGPCFISEDLSNYKNCIIGPYAVVGKNANLAEGCRVERTILNPYSRANGAIAGRILGDNYTVAVQSMT